MRLPAGGDDSASAGSSCPRHFGHRNFTVQLLLRLSLLLQVVIAAPASRKGGGRGDAVNSEMDSRSVAMSGAPIPTSGAVSIGREDMLRVRTSLGRISGELTTIIGIFDRALEALPPEPQPPAPSASSGGSRASTENHIPLPQDGSNGEFSADRGAGSIFGELLLGFGELLMWACIFFLDIGVVTGMQLFLESIGRKRGSGIMSKQNVSGALAAKSPTAGAIPTPTSTSEKPNSSRLSFLSEEDVMAAWLSEHWKKLVAGLVLALACRLPQRIFHSDGLVCSLLTNLAVMLRCMSLVMLLIRDDMTLPKKERDKARIEAAARAEEVKRSLDAAAHAAAAAAQPTPPASPTMVRR
eukprot:CAMPEP_0178420628 /NCGR_PEP_ID=MMETSP0689_2-20121128/26231_1 /TAXON_ID=160604 /ORGANISM="Amphidinium massartii, Strain CS-259" /LENGTH=353 /DNA_ID=CAMNT_0020042117 /DNA_START=29 /DNA_END=1090 /DNA_ORIENTATION=-